MTIDFVNGLLASLQGAFTFLVLITRDSPIGLWSATSALIVPAALGPYLQKYLPSSVKYPLRRQMTIDLVMLTSGMLVAWLPWQTLHGFLVGLVCGLSSSMFWRLTATVVGPLWLWARRKLGVADYPISPKGDTR